MKYASIHHIPIDYLHAILQGVTKQFLECSINLNTWIIDFIC